MNILFLFEIIFKKNYRCASTITEATLSFLRIMLGAKLNFIFQNPWFLRNVSPLSLFLQVTRTCVTRSTAQIRVRGMPRAVEAGDLPGDGTSPAGRARQERTLIV